MKRHFMVATELEDIVNHSFLNCSLIFISLSGGSNTPTAQLNSHLSLESFQHEKYVIGLGGNISSANKNYDGAVDLHKNRDKCTCAFISLIGFENQPYKSVVNLYRFVKSLEGFIKSDEDYFVFQSDGSFNLDWMLINEPFALGIKYKLIVDSGDMAYKTTCFYCNMGQPSIHKFHIKIGETRHNIKDLYPDFLENFHRKTIHVSSASLATSVTELKKTGPGRWENVRGIFGTALEHLSARYNFSFRYFPSIGGGGTGLRLENGTWIGAVGDVIAGRADIGNAVAKIYTRYMYVGYTFPVAYGWMTFTTGLPQRNYSWQAIYWPFTPMMWLCIFLTLILTYFTYSILLTITGQVVPASSIIMYISQILLLQGVSNPETRPLSSTRTFIAFWLLFALLISSTYQSKLVSTLAFPITGKLPKTFKELANTPPTFGIFLHYARGAAYSMIKTNTNPDIHRIFTRLKLEENDVKCFQRVIGTPAACVSFNTEVHHALYQNLSDNFGRTPIVTSQDTTGLLAAGFVLKKRALFRLKFDKVLIWAMDMGLSEQWWKIDYMFLRRRRHMWKKSDSGKETEDENLSMKHLIGTFYILMMGLLASFACFAVEKGWELKSRITVKISIANPNKALC
ncbi:unnamed protein product [Orchesella dallaii]|uniref:Ionotropic glutamate receptor C-terminal domain-containing protein n=1 Tax=Orchesella dallaii TaxID=48710 RepID=A0ABP1QC63_9HEXA